MTFFACSVTLTDLSHSAIPLIWGFVLGVALVIVIVIALVLKAPREPRLPKRQLSDFWN